MSKYHFADGGRNQGKSIVIKLMIKYYVECYSFSTYVYSHDPLKLAKEIKNEFPNAIYEIRHDSVLLNGLYK